MLIVQEGLPADQLAIRRFSREECFIMKTLLMCLIFTNKKYNNKAFIN